MLGGLSLSLDASSRVAALAPLVTEIIPKGGRTVLRITDVDPRLSGVPRLEGLIIDGVSMIDEVDVATSPEIATRPEPGTISGTDAPVTSLTEPAEAGAAYIVSYDILWAAPGATLRYPANGGPFRAGSSSVVPGRYTQVVVAETSETQALMTVTGEVAFASISCRKAEWPLDIPILLGPEQAAKPVPGTISGNGANVSGLISPLTVGESYEIAYEITKDDGENGLYTPANGGAPFATTQLPHTVGTHVVTLTAVDADTAAVARVTGSLTFASFSVRQKLSPKTRILKWIVSVGGQAVHNECDLLRDALAINGDLLLIDNQPVFGDHP